MSLLEDDTSRWQLGLDLTAISKFEHSSGINSVPGIRQSTR